jgi:hypothetical protein
MILAVSVDESLVPVLYRFQMVPLVLAQSSCDDSSSSSSDRHKEVPRVQPYLLILFDGMKFDCFRLAILVQANSCTAKASSCYNFDTKRVSTVK